MDTSVEKPPFAWQPLTPRGLAAFARASYGRLLVIQLIVALLAAGTILWFLQTAWFSIVSQAVLRLPSQGEVRSGSLNWRGASPERLAENHFLAITVDLNHSGTLRSPAHLELEFGRSDLRVISLAGFMPVAYPRDKFFAFNRTELEPWWGAWRPALQALAILGVTAGLVLIWTLLATLYCLPAWLISLFADRALSLPGSWRLAGAALLPGALLLTAAILLYGFGALDLIQLAAVTAAHFILGWVCLLLGLLALPPHPAVRAATPNPFAPADAARSKYPIS